MMQGNFFFTCIYRNDATPCQRCMGSETISYVRFCFVNQLGSYQMIKARQNSKFIWYWDNRKRYKRGAQVYPFLYVAKKKKLKMTGQHSDWRSATLSSCPRSPMFQAAKTNGRRDIVAQWHCYSTENECRPTTSAGRRRRHIRSGEHVGCSR